MQADSQTREAVERVLRESSRRLIALLATRSQDMAAAEDALSDAIQSALETWPKQGVPDVPEAWLLTAARRRLIDEARHRAVQEASAGDWLLLTEEAYELVSGEAAFPDERLKLMFVCTHPAIDIAARAPLMLQVVLGLDAVRIASAFLVKPATLGQRLSRAKAKVRDAGVPFEIPEARSLPDRIEAVLDAIYAAYGAGWDDIAGADARRRGLAEEAIEFGRLLASFMPSAPEALGLLALMLHTDARRHTRRDPNGAYVPLSQQDAQQWDRDRIAQADALLVRAHSLLRMGRYQLEAAIQSVHSRRQ